MRKTIESYLEWFLNQNTLVKAGFIVGLIIIIGLIIFSIFSLVFPDDSPLSGSALANYEASCTSIPFQELNSNPNQYNGQHIQISGQILQIYEDNGLTEIGLEVGQSSGGGSPNDVVFVTYKSTTPFKVGDLITVYGNVAGTYNYVSTNSEIVVAKITARYIEQTINSVSVVPLPFANPEANTSTNTTSNVTSNNTTPATTNVDPSKPGASI